MIFVPMFFLSGLVLSHLAPSLCKKGITEIPETLGIRNHSEVFIIKCFFRQLSIKRSVSGYHGDGIGKGTYTCQGRLKGALEQLKGDHSWGWCGSEGSTKHGMHGSLDLIRPARVFGLLTILFYQVRG